MQQVAQRNFAMYMVQVPFTLREEETPDDWECASNEWDKDHASCLVPQALSDEEIDEILAHQVCNDVIGSRASPLLLVAQHCRASTPYQTDTYAPPVKL